MRVNEDRDRVDRINACKQFELPLTRRAVQKHRRLLSKSSKLYSAIKSEASQEDDGEVESNQVEDR